ncbi:MAG: bifunctional UDP-N-acetylglucosamine diphosphorylase/glucosamine-1-phosphate N-acetyltransferase GlmU [Pseudomonadota bacterium]|nr:bifunctional UDP-N-acetylglucosamine diphosphorylase/glucosamine-1-phosphate N-acetyltransferase GlmU [Pseudomonadota bacterium]
MKTDQTIAIVLAAGEGKRMKSVTPKVLHPLAGRPMILSLVDVLSEISPEKVVLVLGPEMDHVAEIFNTHGCQAEVAIQHERLGTAHAVLSAKKHLENVTGTVIILYGDTPFLTEKTIRSLLLARAEENNPAVVVLGFLSDNPEGYGRLMIDNEGNLLKIVESLDSGDDNFKGSLCNSGVMAIDASILTNFLNQIGNSNAKSEYFLTDIVEIALKNGRKCAFVQGEEEELIGINSKSDLARAETLFQNKLRKKAMEAGVILQDPSSVYFSWDTKLGSDISIGPNVYFGSNVTVEDGVRILSFCHIEGATISKGSIVGPFARLRPGTEIGDHAQIGNFVEVKNSVIESGAKANHLTYIGDAKIGAKSNIGAGAITCNFDGNKKSVTEIGNNVFVGSNTALVAPVKIGDGATIGAGSVITRNVDAYSLGISRVEQRVIPNWGLKKPNKQKDG